MRTWDGERIAAVAGGTCVRRARAGGGPRRACIDSRHVREGDLFVGLTGSRVDGGEFVADALLAGAWGVLATADRAVEAAASTDAGAVICADDPLAALQALATAWRRELGATVIGVTGSTGKTTTKDVLAAMLAQSRAVHASRANYNTEIGLPLAVLSAPPGTEVLVLEMAMRGAGQIAELARIAEPDVGVVTNIGPVHLEQVGSIEGVAAAKGELLGALVQGRGVAVLPHGDARIAAYVPDGVRVVTFGDDEADVRWAGGADAGDGPLVALVAGARVELELPFRQRHNLRNALAALGACHALDALPSGTVDVTLGALRGEHLRLADGVVIVNDCYNANPLSMRAALHELALAGASGRRVAVLGDMLELGPEEEEYHRSIGEAAAREGVDVLVTVGPRAAAMTERFGGEAHEVDDAERAAALLEELLCPGDLVLVKGSRGVGLERVAERLGGVPDEETSGAA